MENKILTSLGRIAGLGGIALGVFLLLFRGVLEKEFLPKAGLGSEHAFAIILALMILTFGIAGIGVIAWLLSRTVGPKAPVPGPALGILAVLIAIVLGSTIYVSAQPKPEPPPAPAERTKIPTNTLMDDARAICGTPHEQVSQDMKGNLEGKAQTLARVGSTELQGAISIAKREIEIGTNRSDAERELHYLNYISCIIIFQDTSLSTDDKLKRVKLLTESLVPTPSSKITTNYVVCVGQYREKCPTTAVFLSCGSSVTAWAKKECESFGETKLSDTPGNQCGYYIANVTCTKSQ